MMRLSFNEYNSAWFKEIIHYHMPLFNLLPSPLVRLFFRTNFGTGVGFTSLPGIGGEGSVCGGRVEGMWKVFGFQWSQTGECDLLEGKPVYFGI